MKAKKGIHFLLCKSKKKNPLHAKAQTLIYESNGNTPPVICRNVWSNCECLRLVKAIAVCRWFKILKLLWERKNDICIDKSWNGLAPCKKSHIRTTLHSSVRKSWPFLFLHAKDFTHRFTFFFCQNSCFADYRQVHEEFKLWCGSCVE